MNPISTPMIAAKKIPTKSGAFRRVVVDEMIAIEHEHEEEDVGRGGRKWEKA